MLPTVIIARNTVDSILAAVVVARSRRQLFDLRFCEDDELPGFFARAVQQALPESYELILVGLSPRRRSLTGQPVRSRLMDSLRTFARPVRWLSVARWDPEDAAAVGHVIGEQDLYLRPSLELCLDLAIGMFGSADPFSQSLVRLFRDEPGPYARKPEWGDRWLKALHAFRLKPDRLVTAAGLLIGGQPELLDAETIQEAEAIERENVEQFVATAKCLPVDDLRLAYTVLPPDRFVFRGDLGGDIRARLAAPVSLLGFPERHIALLASDASLAKRLRDLAHYPVETLSGFDIEQDEAASWSLILPRGLRFESGFASLLSSLGEGIYLLRG